MFNIYCIKAMISEFPLYDGIIASLQVALVVHGSELLSMIVSNDLPIINKDLFAIAAFIEIR